MEKDQCVRCQGLLIEMEDQAGEFKKCSSCNREFRPPMALERKSRSYKPGKGETKREKIRKLLMDGKTPQEINKILLLPKNNPEVYKIRKEMEDFIPTSKAKEIPTSNLDRTLKVEFGKKDTTKDFFVGLKEGENSKAVGTEAVLETPKDLLRATLNLLQVKKVEIEDAIKGLEKVMVIL